MSGDAYRKKAEEKRQRDNKIPLEYNCLILVVLANVNTTVRMLVMNAQKSEDSILQTKAVIF